MTFYQRRSVLLTAASADSSTLTSNAHYVGDYAQLTVQLDSLDTTTSTITLQASNDNGFTSSINTWSDVTGITSAGIYTVDTAFRWIRAQRPSSDSLVNVTIYGVS